METYTQPNRGRWLLFALVLLLVQVLPYLSYRWVTDESWYAGPAYSVAHGHGVADPEIGPNDLEHRFDSRPPGTALVMSVFFRLFGTGQIEARLGSVLAGILVVVFTWKLTHELLGTEAAIAATLITATDNLLVMACRTARPEALTTMAVLLSLLALRQYAKSSAAWAIASGFLIAMAAMFHITVAGYVVSFGLLTIFIDRIRQRRFGTGPALYAVGFFVGLVPFVTWIFTAPLGVRSFKEEYLSRQGQGILTKLIREGHRYADVLGLGILHSHASLPVRLPIPLLFLFASFLLWKYARRWFYLELVLLVPTMLWFVNTVNKSSRYLALIAPVLGMVFGAAITATKNHPTLRKAVMAACGFVIVAQFAANLVLLRGASRANYNALGAQLREVIPDGEPAYGTITFWLALRDHTYISHERTTPKMAMRDDGVRYFILGDRMMTQGDDWDAAFYESMHRSLAQIQQEGTLVRTIDDPYYGKLHIYRMGQ